MLKDRYDNALTTTSQAARDGYVAATDLMLEGQAGIVDAFAAVTRHDPGFALGWAGIARAHQVMGDMPAAAQALAKARSFATGATAREISHIEALSRIFSGQPGAYNVICYHLDSYPRDAILAQTCSSVFGLIGFSGQPGREAEMLAFNAKLLPHYGEDWWAISQYAFALCETGNLVQADRLIDKAMALNPRNAHGAHVRSHVSYELGDTQAGLDYLSDWLGSYDRGGVMFTHLNWHEALWALAQGDVDRMWARVDAAVSPAAQSGGPAINTLTDTVSILHRARLAGVDVEKERWQSVSAFAQAAFPQTGNAFIDVHAALAHAMAGREDALMAILEHPAGPAADLVPDLGAGFQAISRDDWDAASDALMRAMADLARMGGSRAQRDMVEQTLLYALTKQGKAGEARDIAALRRPILTAQGA